MALVVLHHVHGAFLAERWAEMSHNVRLFASHFGGETVPSRSR